MKRIVWLSSKLKRIATYMCDRIDDNDNNNNNYNNDNDNNNDNNNNNNNNNNNIAKREEHQK